MKRYLALSLLTLVVAGCDAMTAHTNVVARAGSHQLTVDGTVDMLAANPEIPARQEVVQSIADLWVDYTILTELAMEDTTFVDLDLEPMLQPYVEQQMFMQLRDQVMTGDTVISDDELERLYEEQAPGLRIRARHILFSFPDEATSAQRDSVMALAESVHERAVAGADFSELAREHSADPGTASQGGDLGWFQRGNMVEPFEEAAFALEVGEVSDVVETPFGLHIIKLDDRDSPALDDVRANFRRQVINERQQASLQSYVDGLREPREITIQRGAEDVARDLAENPAAALRGRAASREIVSWDDGSLTAQELATVFGRMPPQQRAQYAAMDDEQIGSILQEVSTNELVLGDARERGITVPEEEQDSIRGLIREQLQLMVTNAELVGSVQEGETEAEAVQRRVRAYLDGVLTGQHSLLPMGALPHVLRNERDWQVNNAAFAAVIEGLEERRGSADTATGDSAPEPPAQPVVPDSVR